MSPAGDPIEKALRRFSDARPRFERAAEAVIEELRDILGAGGIAPRLTHRVKDLSSYRTKAIQKGYSDPWGEVTDKVGVRALVERASDVDRIHQLIEGSGRLDIATVTDKRLELGTETLGYSGLHLDLWAPPEEGDQEPIPCELQLRTVAQDAWSVVSHRLMYKTKAQLSREDERAIMRLAALVELFDEEVDRVMDKQAALAPAVHAGQPGVLESVVGQYARFERNQGDLDLTRTSLEAVLAAIDPAERDAYPETLAAYVDHNRDVLAQLYAEYGPESQMAFVTDYVLWSQPESVALLESLDSRPNSLVSAWRDAGLPDAWLRPIAAHTGAEVEI
ncbi:GTP pyrophosphokinase [Nocardioides sp.]|uniref:RelA/SpoT domain-containing protein n=1 Tax=metagenome TaxID=256318 RepID=A0A2P2BX93_9ZZZZ